MVIQPINCPKPLGDTISWNRMAMIYFPLVTPCRMFKFDLHRWKKVLYLMFIKFVKSKNYSY